jgi:hypothetical protein
VRTIQYIIQTHTEERGTLQSEYHTAAEKRMLKILLCTGEVSAKSIPASGILFKTKPGSNDKTTVISKKSWKY